LSSESIQDERVRALNDAPQRRGRYVLYWMQAAQREAYNHALEYAVGEANRLRQPVAAVFGLTPDYPEANERHYAFMLEGLAETRAALADRGIQLAVLVDSPERAAAALAGDASLLVVDVGYTRHQVAWRARAAEAAGCRTVQVETDVVVPVETVSDKPEYAAATIRAKIHRHLKRFLVPLRRRPVRRDSLGLRLGGTDLSDVGAVLARLPIDRKVGRVTGCPAGTAAAERRLDDFIGEKLADYPDARARPELDVQSHMSPYLHFGQISPLRIALKVRAARAPRKAREAYLEQLIVRRELSANFVYYEDRYDEFACLPDWARNTLAVHRKDRRDPLYALDDLEGAATHDRYWNAAQREMTETGSMHNTMRMYWGKKILQWCLSPQVAFRVALELNNRYELDGRGPNAFAGVAWCFGKHDRPWPERDIFGKVRYMNAAGLERKYDMGAYLRRVDALTE